LRRWLQTSFLVLSKQGGGELTFNVDPN